MDIRKTAVRTFYATETVGTALNPNAAVTTTAHFDAAVDRVQIDQVIQSTPGGMGIQASVQLSRDEFTNLVVALELVAGVILHPPAAVDDDEDPADSPAYDPDRTAARFLTVAAPLLPPDTLARYCDLDAQRMRKKRAKWAPKDPLARYLVKRVTATAALAETADAARARVRELLKKDGDRLLALVARLERRTKAL